MTDTPPPSNEDLPASSEAPGDEGAPEGDEVKTGGKPAARKTSTLQSAPGWVHYGFRGVWFLLVPLGLAASIVSFCSFGKPNEGSGSLAAMISGQPVPALIVLFSLIEWGLMTIRHRLPFAKRAYLPTRPDIPIPSRSHVEAAIALLDEVDRILHDEKAAADRALSPKKRSELDARLVALDDSIAKTPFNVPTFEKNFESAQKGVDEALGSWRKSDGREFGEQAVLAIAIAMVLRLFVFDAFKIPSGSMIPTLQIGDHLFINKSSYGPKLPYMNSRLWNGMPPNRGDVVVFAFPEEPSIDYIKRVIALPGDRLEVRAGRPVINGWEVPRCTVGTYNYQDVEPPYSKREGELYIEYLGGRPYYTLYDPTAIGGGVYEGPFHVKPGEVYVMGDNRNNSHDSRKWFGGAGGGVPFDNIRGRALIIWLSMNSTGTDWSRIGNLVMGNPKVPANNPGLEPAIKKCLSDQPAYEKTVPPPPKN